MSGSYFEGYILLQSLRFMKASSNEYKTLFQGIFHYDFIQGNFMSLILIKYSFLTLSESSRWLRIMWFRK